MPYATVTTQGEIKFTYTKPNPLVKLNPDERMVKYDPPDVDQAYYDITPVTPVTGKFTEFVVTEKPEAAQLKTANYLVKIDKDVDDIYRLVIGNREPEYRQAELEAQAFQSAGYTGAVPPSVGAYVQASGLKPRTAAENTLQKAEEWRQASLKIRTARLEAKAQVRAGNFANFDIYWADFLAEIQSNLAIKLHL